VAERKKSNEGISLVDKRATVAKSRQRQGGDDLLTLEADRSWSEAKYTVVVYNMSSILYFINRSQRGRGRHLLNTRRQEQEEV
jgi:hypothetical protein